MTIHTEEYKGFKIAFNALPEYMEPDWDFASKDDRKETLRKIDDGTYVYFVAEVTASREGVVLATEYLGGCLYDNYEQFFNDQKGYYADMRDTVAETAQGVIGKLCACV